MSRADTPTLPFVLPEYLRMDLELTKIAKDPTLTIGLRNAVSAGLLKLREYSAHASASQYTMLATSTCFTSFSEIYADALWQ